MTEEQGQYQMETRSKGEALVEIEQQRAIAETQGAMIIAKRYPRDVVAVSYTHLTLPTILLV